jgi:hypothetical protein
MAINFRNDNVNYTISNITITIGTIVILNYIGNNGSTFIVTLNAGSGSGGISTITTSNSNILNYYLESPIIITGLNGGSIPTNWKINVKNKPTQRKKIKAYCKILGIIY